MSDVTGLIGFFGSFQISIIDDPRAKGGGGKRWICSCRRGHPRVNRGRKRQKGIRLPYPCNHLVQIWTWARERKEVHPRFRLTRLGELAADECVCLRGAEPTPLRRHDDERGPAAPLQQQAPTSLRNRPCPCESGLKWRECHGAKDEPGSPAPKAPKRPPKVPQNEPIPAAMFPPGLAPPDAPKAPSAPPVGGPRRPPPVAPPPKPPPAPPVPPEEAKAKERRERAIEREIVKAKREKRIRPILDAISAIDERRREANSAARRARELEKAAGRKRSAEAKRQREQAAELREKAAKIRATANKKAAATRERIKTERARAERERAKARTATKGKKKGKAG